MKLYDNMKLSTIFKKLFKAFVHIHLEIILRFCLKLMSHTSSTFQLMNNIKLYLYTLNLFCSKQEISRPAELYTFSMTLMAFK